MAWAYLFAHPYVGEVYANITSGTFASKPAVITMIWGPWTWQQIVPVRPGEYATNQGGTLLLFHKVVGTNRPNPPLYLTSNVPVCVSFGTALGGTPQPNLVVNANPNWVHE